MEFIWTLFMCIAIAVAGLLIQCHVIYWWRPRRMELILRKQGMRGTTYRFFFGDMLQQATMIRDARSMPLIAFSQNIVPRILPHYEAWSTTYGESFFYWHGVTPTIIISEPHLVKQVLCDKHGHFGKPPRRPDSKDFIGNGLVALRGDSWAYHRRIINPFFSTKTLKKMVPTILHAANAAFDQLQEIVSGASPTPYEVEICELFRILTADIIARVAFGSSYKEGKEIFEMQRKQQALIDEGDNRVYVPGSRFFPTRKNRYRWAIQKKIKAQLRQLIQGRIDSAGVGDAHSMGDDLLGQMLTASMQKPDNCRLRFGIEEIVDECQNFFFAGHDTTSTLLAWTTMLLSQHPEWQDKARVEALDVYKAESRVEKEQKIMTMVLHESLRLYPPAVSLKRYTYKEVKLGNLMLPKGIRLILPILVLHHSRELWGDDAEEFKPARFGDGVKKAAKHPFAFMPFSMGPRVCVGEHFAMLEAKLILSAMLQRFSFQLSPAYRHGPTNVVTLQSQYGVHVHLHVN